MQLSACAFQLPFQNDQNGPARLFFSVVAVDIFLGALDFALLNAFQSRRNGGSYPRF